MGIPRTGKYLVHLWYPLPSIHDIYNVRIWDSRARTRAYVCRLNSLGSAWSATRGRSYGQSAVCGSLRTKWMKTTHSPTPSPALPRTDTLVALSFPSLGRSFTRDDRRRNRYATSTSWLYLLSKQVNPAKSPWETRGGISLRIFGSSPIREPLADRHGFLESPNLF